jgi:hypothetical protein
MFDDSFFVLLLSLFPIHFQAAPIAEAVADAFKMAAAIRTDPFAINRPSTETPEAVSGVFAGIQLPREKLTARMIIGQGQVSVRRKY